MIHDLPDLTPRCDLHDLVVEVVTALAGLSAASLLVIALVVV